MSAADRSGVVALPDGAHLAHEEHGARHNGVPVLLLRPLVGAMALWGGFLDALASRLRVIAFDPRGTGASSDAPADATTRDLARDPVALLDALGEPAAHVFGISFGAMVATWLAIDAPERVARLCLASAGPTGFALTASGLARGISMAGPRAHARAARGHREGRGGLPPVARLSGRRVSTPSVRHVEGARGTIEG